ncbi:hypothetical protein ACFE04_002414 [Oxalis oulophora]
MANICKIVELDVGWAAMEIGIDKLKNILEGLPEPPFNSAEYMTLYTTIYNMCIQKQPHDYSQQLYEKYGKEFSMYIPSTVLPLLREKHDEFMLIELVKRWKNHKIMVRWLSRFFHYIDRYFVTRRSMPTLNEVGLICFRDLVFNELNGKARNAVLALINKEREGEQIDRALLKNVIDIFVEIGMGEMESYERNFEEPMIEDSGSYYSRKASKWIVEDSCPEYMLKASLAEECLKMERDRVSHYLQASSESKLVEKVQQELLVVYDKMLFEKEHSGVKALLKNNKKEDLSRMYRLYHKIPNGLEPVANFFKQHIIDVGNALVQSADDAGTTKAGQAAAGQDEVLFKKIINLHDNFMGYVSNCFLQNSLFNKVVKLLAYISDKDLFAEFFRKKLARRLLFDRSASDENERSILTKLKQQCGGQFTSKMEGMVTDLTVAKDIQGNFESYLQKNDGLNLGVDLSVTVLTTGFWPTYKSSDLILPREMVKCVEVFQGFYGSTTNSRRLSWISSLGSCNVQGKFDAKPVELIVSTYQAAILLLFNSSDKLSYSEIMTQTNLTHDDLNRLLHSLSCAKYKILLKEPNTKTISDSDTFEFNSKFTDKMRRIKIPLPAVDERKKVIEDVDKDRRYAIDAALVRIMKSRKVLGHQQLVSECVELLSRMFKPDIKAIKKRMEDLIARDYLERDVENPNMFKYVA